MRVAIFSDNFYPELSGVADSVVWLAQGLDSLGHEVAIFAPEYSSANYSFVGLKDRREPDLGANVKIVRLPSIAAPTLPQGRIANPLSGERAFMAFDPDIVHTQLYFGTGLAALRLAKKYKKPVVGTNHTPMTEILKHSPIKGAWATKLIDRYVNWYYGKCDYLTVPSHYPLDEMVATGYKGPGLVLSNPIDTKTFYPVQTKKPLKERFGFSDHTVITLGRLAPEKQMDVVIKAMPKVLENYPDAIFALAGDGAARKQLEALAKQLNIAEHIKFMGALGKDDLAQFINAGDVFAIASLAEVQPLSIMESLACGVPVIGVKAGPIPECIPSDSGFLVEPGDHEAFARKISYLFEYEDKRKEMGRNAYRYTQQFSLSNIAKEWETLYKKVLATKGIHENQLRSARV